MDLPLEASFSLGQAELLLEIARQLLRERAGALGAPPLDDVGQRRDGDAPDVDAEVAVELGVLGRDDRLAQQRVDVVVADDDAALRGELADELAVRRVDARDGARRVVVERGDLRQVAGVREEHAAQDAEQRGDDEQGDDPGVAGEADDVRASRDPDLRRAWPKALAAMARLARSTLT